MYVRVPFLCPPWTMTLAALRYRPHPYVALLAGDNERRQVQTMTQSAGGMTSQQVETTVGLLGPAEWRKAG